MTRIMRACASIIGLAALIGIGIDSPPASASEAAGVAGTWQTLVPVAFTSYQPSAADPTTGTYSGVGSTLWQGTWTGVTHYTIHGTANLVTGAGSGALHETFIGRSDDGGTGTIDLSETYTLDPTGNLIIWVTIDSGTGDFTGSRGNVVFTGVVIGAVEGNGAYSGSWTRVHHPHRAYARPQRQRVARR